MYQGYGAMEPLWVTPGGVLNNRHGAFHHDDLIGVRFGAKVTARSSQARGRRAPGWLHVLQPTPDLWSMCVRQRTQIIQPSDQAVILSQLWLRGGSVVLESGTGSGIFTTALARTVAPTGRVHTFEFNGHRAAVAQEELARNGLGDAVVVSHRDVCEDGFPGALDGCADAVMLDVPSPWLAIKHAKRALKTGGRLCCYSPCIEQVQRNCAAMREEGFHSVITIECRLRKFDVRETTFMLPEFMPLEDLKGKYADYVERKAARAEREAAAEAEAAKAGAAAAATAGAATDRAEETTSSSDSVLGKRERKGGRKNEPQKGKKGRGESGAFPGGKKKGSASATGGAGDVPMMKMGTARPVPLARGHTAFLSFATL